MKNILIKLGGIVKKALFFVLVIAITFSLMAQTDNLRYLPVAETDDFWSPLLNPAAMGFGNSKGFAFAGEDRDQKFREDYYSLFFNMAGLSYVLQHDGSQETPADRHTLAIGERLSQNLYFGVKYDWQNKYFDHGRWGFSGMWRPSNYLSLAATSYDIRADKEEYRLGMSIRPLGKSKKLSRKLTLSGDVFYAMPNLDGNTDASDQLEWQKPVISISSEILRGLFVSGSYDLEHERIGANLSLAFPNSKIGNIFGFNDDNEYAVGNMYLHLTDYNKNSISNPYSRDRYHVWELKGEITNQKSGYKIGPFNISDKKQQSVTDLLNKIKELKEDDNIKGIVFKNPRFLASFAVRQELVDALLDFKSEGKNIIIYSDNLSGAQYCFAAAVSDAIYLNKNGGIDLRGISISVPYFKGLLDTLGIDVTNFQSHEYKTAFNSFSYDHMTDAERETYEYLLDGIYHDMKEMIMTGRGDKLKAPLEEIIDKGPYPDGSLAYDLGLVDYLIYEDEFSDLIKEEFAIKNFSKKMQGSSLPVNWYKPEKDKIAIIYAVGSINMGKGKQGKVIGSETTAKAIKKAREDKSVKGIILRVDSGGGSAFASDVINREIELCRQEKNRKPVVASMSGAAASGGYYISSNADKILAQSSTITGSIGVIGVWPSFERLYRKIHINWVTVKKGAHSDFGNTSRAPEEDEIEIVRNFIDKTYNDFLIKVAQGRNMSKESVHEIAMGRVWTGRQALERGLVDKLGGLDDAIDEVKALAGITSEVRLVDYSGYETKFDLNVDMSGIISPAPKLDIPPEMQALLDWWKLYELYHTEKALMISPIEILE
jgi:protease IV